MKIYKIKYIAIAVFSLFIISCNNNDDDTIIAITTNFSGTFVQKDQMGRPAVNTVFVSAASKDEFNTTIPSQQGAMFQSMFKTNLLGLSPAYANAGKNALGQDAAAFTGLLATDVLNVS